MAFSVNSFKTNGLFLGGARPALFRATVNFPQMLQNNSGTELIDSVSTFFIRTASLPASTMGVAEVPYFGRKIKLSGDRTFSDWNVTVLNDENFYLRHAFEKWSNAINKMQNNYMDPAVAQNISDNSSYKVTLKVEQFSKAQFQDFNGPATQDAQSGNVIRTYMFHGAFPSDISAINLDWDTTNQVEQFDVTFAYDYWELMGSSGDGNQIFKQ